MNSQLSQQEQQRCIQVLKKSVLMCNCNDNDLSELAKYAVKKEYHKGDILSREGEPQKTMFVISEGSVVRERNIDGKIRNIDTHVHSSTVGSLHILNQDPSYATTKCLTNVTAYEFTSPQVNQIFKTNPNFAWCVTDSLVSEVRTHTRDTRTPLLEQHPTKTPFLAVSIAASIESFYRAALNSVLNQQLTGVKMTSLLPNMHIQVPTRVAYINGFKGIRQYLDKKIKPDEYQYPTLVKIFAAIAPGIIMTPVSSILEASNAGNANPESMYKRWTRGLVPRAGREVIFGIGLNQLSDYCEERVPIQNEALKNAAGSLMAGVVSGYLSHVVHNMSTLKLMNPNKTYREHFKDYIAKSNSRLPKSLPSAVKPVATFLSAFVFPIGVHIRTGQIVGSFIILNGTINALHGLDLQVKWNSKN